MARVCGGMCGRSADPAAEALRCAPAHRVVFYRDGVSEGQFAHVMKFEVSQLKVSTTSTPRWCLGVSASWCTVSLPSRWSDSVLTTGHSIGGVS